MTQSVTLSWINENPHIPQSITSDPELLSSYRSRKSHTKSRNGCQNCRRRRIKCDEAKPGCGQCIGRLLGPLQCGFSVSSKSVEEDVGPLSAQANINSISRTSARDKIVSHLESSGFSNQHFKEPIYKLSDAVELLDHFVEADASWIGPPLFQRIVQQHGLELCLDAPYLLHAILAFSASHLNSLRPDEKKYSIAFTTHYELSLSSYTLQLRINLDSSNANAIVASSHLHTMLAFRNVQLRDIISDDDDEELTWLRAMRGVSILWNTDDLYSHLKASIWREMESEPRVMGNVICNHTNSYDADSWASETSRAFHELFEADCDSEIFTNSYKDALNCLCQLMQFPISRDTICAFMSFVGELPNSFVQLLDQKDPKAMLILCYWSALLSQIDSWWIEGAAHVVCKGLCAYLDMIPDPRIHDLLHFPTSMCGYVMNTGTTFQ